MMVSSCGMSSKDQLEGVQQQNADVLRKASPQAGDEREVILLRHQLEQLDKARVALQEEKALLFRGQQGGEHCSPSNKGRHAGTAHFW